MEIGALIAGGVAHEFNNMLAAFSGTLQRVRDNLPAGQLVFELEAAERLVDRAALLTHTLFSIERGDKGEREATSMQKAVEDVLSVIESRFHKRGIKIVRRYGDVPAISASRCGLMHVVIEMLVSAERACGDKGGNIEVSTGATALHGWLAVSDDGTRGDAADLQNGAAGLGGRLEVAKKSDGTRRVLTLPLWQDAAVEQELEQVGKGLRVLVVDDEKAIRKVLTVVLESRGFEVRTVDSAEAAVEKLEKDEFDVILLDLVMPGMQGTALLERLRRDRPKLPVIIISGETVDPSVEELRKRGAAAVMRKPLKLDRLAKLCKAVANGEEIGE